MKWSIIIFYLNFVLVSDNVELVMSILLCNNLKIGQFGMVKLVFSNMIWMEFSRSF